MEKIWIVTKPTRFSEILDILFECDGIMLELQFRGGLKGEEVVGFYCSYSEAKAVAEKLIKAVNI